MTRIKRRLKSIVSTPVDSREASENIPETLVQEFDEPADVAIFDGFDRCLRTNLRNYTSL